MNLEVDDYKYFLRWFWTQPESWSPTKYQNWRAEFQAVQNQFPEVILRFKALERMGLEVTQDYTDFTEDTEFEILS